MICPNCKHDAIAYWRVWIRGIILPVTCLSCKAKLKVKHSKLGNNISATIGIPIGLLFAAGLSGIYWNVYLVVAFVIPGILIDVFYNRHQIEFLLSDKEKK